MPLEQEIVQQMQQLEDKDFAQKAQEFIKNPSKKHKAYNEYLDKNSMSVKCRFYFVNLRNQFWLLLNKKSACNQKNKAQAKYNLVDTQKFILKTIKKDGLKILLLTKCLIPTLMRKN